MKNIITVVGARPNFMKVAPLLRLLDSNINFNSLLVHTGQHYDHKMSDVFFNELEIRKPDFNLDVGSASHAQQTSKIMLGFEELCIQHSPELVIVVGDVNSTVACSLVAKKLNIRVAHIEAGLRSNDRNMPEEINRIVTDSISDYFFVTEQSGVDNLNSEGKIDNVYFIGNLMIDSLHFGLKKIKNRKTFFEKNYGLVTLHRPSNVDNVQKLKQILEALEIISEELPLFFSIHPRTQNIIEHNNIEFSKNINILKPQPYLSFLHIMRDAKMVFTDSGGIQEETTALKKRCFTIRENTERPITLLEGSNVLAGTSKKSILNNYKSNKQKSKEFKIPKFWDGKSSSRLIKILDEII
jgi:UDP-N-acetylglucosamine 2-epimerase (non-hydrolysing)